MAAQDVEFEAIADADGRFGRLAELLGLADADHARGKVEHLWMACTTRGETDLPQWLVERHLGERGPAALVEAELARWARGRGDSKTRRLYICGSKKRCLWLRNNQEQSSKGGKARADRASRVAGKFSADGLVASPAPSPSPSPSPSPQDPESLSPARDPAAPSSVPAAKPTPDLGPIASAVPELAAELARRDAKPASLIPPGESAWHRRRRWWSAMLEADARLRASGIEPNSPAMPKAPAGANETNMNRCERQLIDGGSSPDEVDAKMRHIVLVAEAEARREGHRRWFKPACIWDPERAARAVDTSLDEASQARPPPRSSAGRAPARDIRVGQIQPKDPSAYPDGEIEIT